jgi:hypothetical protein
VQAAQLRHDEEQEENDGSAGVLEVLPLLSEAYAASGVEVVGELASWRLGESRNHQLANSPIE